MDLLNEIKIEDLTADQQDVAEIIGLDAYKKLIRDSGGLLIYIPKSDTVTIAARNRKVNREFNGYNVRDLAKRYGLSEVTIRQITAEKSDQIRTAPLKDQISLFDK